MVPKIIDNVMEAFSVWMQPYEKEWWGRFIIYSAVIVAFPVWIASLLIGAMFATAIDRKKRLCTGCGKNRGSGELLNGIPCECGYKPNGLKELNMTTEDE